MTFLLDTSILNQLRNVEEFAEFCAARGHRIEIPALVHIERLFQLRREHGENFDESMIRSWFDRFESVVSVQPITTEFAELIATRLHGRVPTDPEWTVLKDDGHSLDAYIVATADPQRPIVGADSGPAWKACPPGTVVTLEEARNLAGR